MFTFGGLREVYLEGVRYIVHMVFIWLKACLQFGFCLFVWKLHLKAKKFIFSLKVKTEKILCFDMVISPFLVQTNSILQSFFLVLKAVCLTVHSGAKLEKSYIESFELCHTVHQTDRFFVSLNGESRFLRLSRHVQTSLFLLCRDWIAWIGLNFRSIFLFVDSF